MKVILPVSCPCVATAALYALSLASGFGQTTESTTDPVGLIELSVMGTSTGTPRLSLVSPTLTRPVLWQGIITGVSAAGTTGTVGVSGAPWTSNQFNGANGSHYVELVSTTTPAVSGTLLDIKATRTNQIDTGGIPGAAIGDSIKIRKDVTLSDVFGANNSAGLLGSSIDASAADEVLIYSGASSTSYFYYTGIPAGWYNSTTGDPAGDTSIAPNEAVVIKRKTSGNLAITFAGAVKSGDTLIPIQNGLNVLGTASAKGLTLAGSGLYTGNPATGVKGSAVDASAGDEVILYTAGGSAAYFYYTGAPAGWYHSTTGDPAGATPIAPGTAFVLKRKNGVAFNWVLPSPTSF